MTYSCHWHKIFDRLSPHRGSSGIAFGLYKHLYALPGRFLHSESRSADLLSLGVPILTAWLKSNIVPFWPQKYFSRQMVNPSAGARVNHAIQTLYSVREARALRARFS
jgi:hypothetical protein